MFLMADADRRKYSQQGRRTESREDLRSPLAAADAGDINGAWARGVLPFGLESRDECDVSEF